MRRGGSLSSRVLRIDAVFFDQVVDGDEETSAHAAAEYSDDPLLRQNATHESS